MGKDKIRRFSENLTFKCMVQPAFEEVFGVEHPMKGKWHEFFGNNNPIVLELGCGRGEYTVALAERNPDKNFIGVDIKGARMWRGAKTVTEKGITNAGFLRTRIEFISSLFAEGEVSEIWITFPDPQMPKQRAKHRLTGSLFLARYAKILAEGGMINLKTDSQFLHEYTKMVIAQNELPVEVANNDIYGTGYADETLSVKTAYEAKFLAQGMPITYLRFALGGKVEFCDITEEMEDKLQELRPNKTDN